MFFFHCSWDDSSSVSSGLSDTLDNLSTDDLNTTSSVSSYSNITASSRKNAHAQVSSFPLPFLATPLRYAVLKKQTNKKALVTVPPKQMKYLYFTSSGKMLTCILDGDMDQHIS